MQWRSCRYGVRHTSVRRPNKHVLKKIRIIPCPIFSPPRHPRRLAPSRRCAQVCGCAPARPMTAAMPCPHPVILPSCPSAAALPSVLPAAGSRAPSVPRPELRPAPSRASWARWLLRRSLSTALPPELPLAPWRLAGFGISHCILGIKYHYCVCYCAQLQILRDSHCI
jgi:hypothetical protein